jgi:hypothetical protein
MVFKQIKMKWAGYIGCMGVANVYTTFLLAA